MTNANNMYVEGVKTERGWEGRAREEAAGAASCGPNRNQRLSPGTTITPPARHLGFSPSLEAKELRPVAFPELAPGASPGAIRDAIAWVDQRVGWFHAVPLPHGIATPGSTGWAHRRRIFAIPERVRDKTVLDVGAMEGGDTFGAEDAGAAEVAAADVDHYFQYDLGRNAAWDFVVDKYLHARDAGPEAEWVFLNSKRFGFELCRTARGSRARRLCSTVYDLDPDAHGIFDVVFCFGLLYHLRHPLLALDRLASVTGQTLLVNNQVFDGPTPEANSVLFFNDTWGNSYTNWFVPSHRAFVDMLAGVGFRKIEVIESTDRSMSLACHK